ncbi:MAG: hypothetical protein ACR2NB_07180 [Solirubrobacteraceae bacterium]
MAPAPPAEAAAPPVEPIFAPPADSPPKSFPGSGLPAQVLNSDLARERPEVVIAGAFVGAFLLARILKRLGR